MFNLKKMKIWKK